MHLERNLGLLIIIKESQLVKQQHYAATLAVRGHSGNRTIDLQGRRIFYFKISLGEVLSQECEMPLKFKQQAIIKNQNRGYVLMG